MQLKLTPEDIDFIKNNKTIKQKDIAVMFNIHQSYISKLTSGKKYRAGASEKDNEYFNVDLFGKLYQP